VQGEVGNVNELHTTINGVKEEGGIVPQYLDRGDQPAKASEYSWNGYPLPLGLRINVWKREKEKTGPKATSSDN
jgi:hypothetical protein